jgi:hypothetical protein
LSAVPKFKTCKKVLISKEYRKLKEIEKKQKQKKKEKDLPGRSPPVQPNIGPAQPVGPRRYHAPEVEVVVFVLLTARMDATAPESSTSTLSIRSTRMPEIVSKPHRSTSASTASRNSEIHAWSTHHHHRRISAVTGVEMSM